MKKSWFTITNKADSECEICLHDEIGAWGIPASEFAATLRDAGKVGAIVLNINSPGGSCDDGFTIYDAIKSCQVPVSVNVTGLAASMASVIMLAGDKGKVRIAENGRVMIHRVTGGAFGNSDDLDAAAKLVKQFEDRIIAIYTERTGKSEADIRDMMKAELGTWFFGKEAVANGFADEVIAGAKAKAFQPEWASLFTMLPAALFQENVSTNKKPFDNVSTNDNTTTNSMTNPEQTPAELELAKIEAKKNADAIAARETQIASDAVIAERKRVTDIQAWSKEVSDARKIDLAAVTASHIADGKTLQDFKEHVLMNEFKSAPLVTPTDHATAQGNTLKREEFEKLSPYNQSDFCRKGGKIVD